MAGTEFDDDTTLTPVATGAWDAQVTDRWMIGAGPNGGYLAGMVTRGLCATSPQPDPLTATFHYPSRPAVGPAQLAVRVDHATRSHAFVSAELRQDGELRVRATAVFGRRRDDQMLDVTLRSPVAAAVAKCDPWHRGELPGTASFLERFDRRLPAGSDPLNQPPGGPAEIGGWTRLVDRDLDDVAVPLFADCWPPAMFVRHGFGMAPTLELTVHFRNAPRPGWHWCHFRSHVLAGGYVEEDGEIWAEDGALIAQSRQLSRFAVAGGG